MMGDPIEWIEWIEIREQGFRNEAEHEFLTALFAHTPNQARRDGRILHNKLSGFHFDGRLRHLRFGRRV